MGARREAGRGSLLPLFLRAVRDAHRTAPLPPEPHLSLSLSSSSLSPCIEGASTFNISVDSQGKKKTTTTKKRSPGLRESFAFTQRGERDLHGECDGGAFRRAGDLFSRNDWLFLQNEKVLRNVPLFFLLLLLFPLLPRATPSAAIMYRRKQASVRSFQTVFSGLSRTQR